MPLNARLSVFVIIAVSMIWVQGAQNNIAFELSDLTKIIGIENNREFQLEAFKSVNNDKIIKEGNRAKYSRLFWVTLGYPRLLKTASWLTPTDHRIFHEQEEGFYTYIQTLTREQRQLLRSTANTKYNVNVTADQIVHLVLKRFTCNIQLFEMGKRFLIKGEVSNFHNYPLRMDFIAPFGSRERRLFKKRLEMYMNGSTSIRLTCSVESPGQRTRMNTLTITSKSSQQLGIKEKLFGSSSREKGTVYVTRKQMNSLASDLFSRLSIVEEYSMPEQEFSEAFVQAFVKQMAEKGFSQVSFENALSALSKYTLDFSDDLKPDIIKRDMGQIFKIESTNNKSHIVVNEEQSESLNDKHTSSLKLGFLGIFGLSASVKIANTQSKEWSKGHKSLKDQIHELNRESAHRIEWTVEGTKVVPKSINVAKIDEAKIGNTLRFERIRRYITDAPFQRQFSLYTYSSNLTDGFYKEKRKKQVTSKCEAMQVMISNIVQLLHDSEVQRRIDIEKIMQMHNNSEVQRRIDIEKIMQMHNNSEVQQCDSETMVQLRNESKVQGRIEDNLEEQPITEKYPPPLPSMLDRQGHRDGLYQANMMSSPRGDLQWTLIGEHFREWQNILTKNKESATWSPAIILPTFLQGIMVRCGFKKDKASSMISIYIILYGNNYNTKILRLPVTFGLAIYFFQTTTRVPLAVGNAKKTMDKSEVLFKFFDVNKYLFTVGQTVRLELLFYK